MALYEYHAVANGLRTDHPIPGLPFVDDSHIPVEDGDAVEAVGRRHGTDMWGRIDRLRRYGGWTAFTTDPVRHDLAWTVRWHPDHGRSVVLYRDKDAASVHTVLEGPTLLFRSGGYWWDGTTWYRPGQVWDAASEEYYRRPVPAAVTVTAADMLSTGTPDPTQAAVLAVSDVDPEAPLDGQWLNHLALWARSRDSDLTRNVVTLTAPELVVGQLISVAELADTGGVAASTLRAYIARGEADVPLPQATVNGRNYWARPVAEEWAEQRRRSPEGVTLAVSAERSGASLPVGVADLWRQYSDRFFARLWDHPGIRRRWALRWRTETAVRQVADDLSWEVAAGLRDLIDLSDLAATITHAVLDDLSAGQQLDMSMETELRLVRPGDAPAAITSAHHGISRGAGRMLGWLVKHDPARAASTISTIVGEAERRLDMPRKVSERSIRVSLSMDGKLDDDALDQFLSRVLTPRPRS